MPEQKLIGNFVALTESTLDSKQWKAFTASIRCVYTTMMRKYYRKGEDANGRVIWKQEELAEEAGFTRRTIITCIGTLIDEGWISVWEPGDRWGDGTEYEMKPEWANGKE